MCYFYYFSVSSLSQLRATQGLPRHHLIIWLAAAFATTRSFFLFLFRLCVIIIKPPSSSQNLEHHFCLTLHFHSRQTGGWSLKSLKHNLKRGRMPAWVWTSLPSRLPRRHFENWSLFEGVWWPWDTTRWVVDGSLNLPFPSNCWNFLGKTFNWAGQTRSLPVVNLSRIRGQ